MKPPSQRAEGGLHLLPGWRPEKARVPDTACPSKYPWVTQNNNRYPTADAGPDRQSAWPSGTTMLDPRLFFTLSSVDSPVRSRIVAASGENSGAIARTAQAKTAYPARDRRIPQSPLVKQNLLVKSCEIGDTAAMLSACMTPVAALFRACAGTSACSGVRVPLRQCFESRWHAGKARKVQANSGKLRRWASIIPALRFRGERSGHALGDRRGRARETGVLPARPMNGDMVSSTSLSAWRTSHEGLRIRTCCLVRPGRRGRLGQRPRRQALLRAAGA